MKAKDFVNEKWTEKYKKSINCQNPKGFSQKAHCDGRKKNEDAAATMPNTEIPDVKKEPGVIKKGAKALGKVVGKGLGALDFINAVNKFSKGDTAGGADSTLSGITYATPFVGLPLGIARDLAKSAGYDPLDYSSKAYPKGPKGETLYPIVPFESKSNVLKGIVVAEQSEFNTMIKNITAQNPKGSAAEKILLGRFLGSDQGVYARNVLGKDHTGWIEHITSWLKKNQPRLQKEFNELDFSDLESLAYDMYENYLAKQGQLEEEKVEKVNPNDNFNINDIHALEKIEDLETLKKKAKHLIKGKPIRRMKQEKIAYFYDRVDTLSSRMKVIKLMYDLLLAGEGLKTVGSWHSMDPNHYARRFNEGENEGYSAGAVGGAGLGEEQDFKSFINKALTNKVEPTPKKYDPNTTMGFHNMPGYKNALDFGMAIISKMDDKTKKYYANKDEDVLLDYLLKVAKRNNLLVTEFSAPTDDDHAEVFRGGKFYEEDLFEVPGMFDEVFHDPNIGSSWTDLLKDNLNEYEEKRIIQFSKDNPPDMDYLYQQFIQRMLNPENTIDPNDWIDEVNKYYGLNYSWKDYQTRGRNDHTNNWQRIVNRYIVNRK